MKKHILLFSPFFYPEPISTGKYNTFLVKRLIERGIPVDVVSFYPLYPSWRPQLISGQLPGVKIFRGGKWCRYPKRILFRRAVLECAFLMHVFRFIGRIHRYSDVIVVLPPMLIMTLVWMAAGPNTRVTAIAHDLQGIMAATGIKRGGRAGIRLIRRLESLVLICCHRVIALSDAMAAFLSASYGLPRSKIAVCRPFVTVAPDSSGNRIAHLFDGDKKHVVYAGGLGHKQCPEKLVEFFYHLAQKREDVVCHVFSGGPFFDALRKDEKWKSQRLVFHDLVPESDLSELYLRSHIQVIPEMAGLSQGAVPSKLPNLLATGVPILYIGDKDSDVRKLIQRCRAGICSDNWDFDALSDLADQLLIDGGKRPHAVRRVPFVNEYAGLFSVETLIKTLLE
jgi:colanic acid biosynthesis glycosyl transferase WcaI